MSAARPISVVIAAVSVVVLAACGGGGSSATTSAAAPATTAAPSTAAAAPSTASGAAAQGKQLFTSVGCASCHTLAAAGSTGQVGPNLDNLKPSEAQVARQVTNGGGGMPAFGKTLTAAQIHALAVYVSQSAS